MLKPPVERRSLSDSIVERVTSDCAPETRKLGAATRCEAAEDDRCRSACESEAACEIEAEGEPVKGDCCGCGWSVPKLSWISGGWWVATLLLVDWAYATCLAEEGSVRSRRLAGLSVSPLAALLRAPPMDVAGTDVFLGFGLRVDLVKVALLRPDDGRLHSGCGPDGSQSPIEKERLDVALSSSGGDWSVSGEEATLGAKSSLSTEPCSLEDGRSSTCTAGRLTPSLEETNTGLYLRSG